MELNGNGTNIKVFIANSSPDIRQTEDKLVKILEHAGMDVLRVEESEDIDQIIKQSETLMEQADCSIHLIGDQYDYIDQLDASLSEYQFSQANRMLKKKDNFKIFVWRPGYLKTLPENKRQKNFWYSILNNINENIIYSMLDSAIMFVEDIRNIMYSDKSITYETKPTEIYLIFNEVDEPSALTIKDLLSDVAKVESTSISLSSEVDYNDFIALQIEKSVLPVIYFKKASVWASYFIKEIWRKTGGLSSGKTILLVGDDSIPENKDIEFSADNVEIIITSEELIPLEIKVALDKVKNLETA